MTLDEAKGIVKQTRTFFATGGKSGNKIYAAGEDGLAAFNRQLDAALNAQPLDDEGVLAMIQPKGTGLTKAGRRTANAAVAQTMIEVWRSGFNGGSAVEYGRLIVDSGRTCGNCTEMASVAAYLVAKGSKSEIIRIVVTDGPGDHVFTVVGEPKGWAKICNPPPDRTSIVIDPWANVCCVVADYFDAFSTKMAEWCKVSKRIATGGSSYVLPDAKYLSAFGASAPNFSNARNSWPF